jgi:CHASE2 domain-containing sensor protein
MEKTAELKFTAGDFEQGFQIDLDLKEDGRSVATTEGYLPPLPQLPEQYQRWQDTYRGSGILTRLTPVPIQGNITMEECQLQANELSKVFNTWLLADSFREIQNKLRMYLNPGDQVRLILEVKDDRIQKLPWQRWKFLEDFTNAEISIANRSKGDRVEVSYTPSAQVRILAILGDSRNIDVKTDRTFLAAFPGADVTFLVEPDRAALSQALSWEGPWDILYFAGHSFSEKGNQKGYLCINPDQNISVEEFRNDLVRSIKQGLQIAIFNSCDGLGLAKSLADLNIPQTIFMREPVPDAVAQDFLKSFLRAFSQGESLYQAVRSAREGLQHLEDRFLCATWLPVIYQNPLVTPPTWQGFLDRIKIRPLSKRRVLATLIASIVLVGGTVIGLRQLNGLAQSELNMADHLMGLRGQLKPEPWDDRIVVIEIASQDYDTEKIKQIREKVKGNSMSADSLKRLIDRLKIAAPSAIGLDLYRGTDAFSKDEAKQLNGLENLVGICRQMDGSKQEKSPPPWLNPNFVGFVNAIPDIDGVQRRQIVAMSAASLPQTATCQTESSLSTHLALLYLQKQGFGDRNFDKIQFLDTQPSYYRSADLGGDQILTNYRMTGGRQLPEIPTISLTRILNEPLTEQMKQMLRGKVVLIGVTHRDSEDIHQLPAGAWGYSAKGTPGVLIQAQQVSDIISTLLGERKALWFLSSSGELLWIVGWSIAGTALGLGLYLFCRRLTPLLAPRLHNSYLSSMIGIGGMSCLVYGVGAGVFLAYSGILPILPGILAGGMAIVAVQGLLSKSYKIQLPKLKPEPSK